MRHVKVDHHEICRIAGPNRVKAEQPARIDAHSIEKRFNRNKPCADKPFIQYGEGAFKSHYSVKTPGKPLGFLVCGVGSVIGGDAVNGSVKQAFDKRIPILP